MRSKFKIRGFTMLFLTSFVVYMVIGAFMTRKDFSFLGLAIVALAEAAILVVYSRQTHARN